MSRIPDRLRDERGGVMVIVGLLFGLGVLLGAASLAIDTGKLMWERRELQNGADAAAFALAQNCAKGVNCVQNDPGVKSLAIKNAADALHTLERQCRSTAVVGGLAECTAPGNMADIKECPPLPPAYSSTPGLKYVEVRTESLSKDGGLVKNLFARISGGDAETTLISCARAAWGPAGGAKVLPLTFATCEYEEIAFDVETSLPLKYKDATCLANPAPSGGDFSGGFGFLVAPNCESQVDANKWVEGDSGIGKVGNECLPAVNPGDTVYIPIFDCLSETKTMIGDTCVRGNPKPGAAYYHIDGFAAFHVTAIDITGPSDGTPGGTAKKECKHGSAGESLDGKCIYGWFLDDYVDGTGFINPGGGGDYGTVTVQPMG